MFCGQIGSNMISDNAINNNSLVCKLNYKKFSMLFTGDIEEIAEKTILSKYAGKNEILKSDIGINPNNDGKVIRLVFPELNEERRKELVKEIKKIAEEAKVAIRSIRRDGIDEAKAKQKNSEITEDELKVAETEIQKITDKNIEEIDKILTNKETEIMSV